MKNRVFLIHGWEGRPDGHWFPWLSLELKARGWEVNAPQMLHAAEPKVSEWLSFLKKYVGKPDRHTYFVGHSLGCNAIVRYIELLPKTARVGGCVFVAGFSVFAREEDERLQKLSPAPLPGRARVRTAHSLSGEAQARITSGAGVGQPFYTIPEIAEFYSLPFDAEAAKKHCDKFVMIFSDNDPFVPMERSLEFAQQLGAKTILERGRGHFTARENVTALPSALKALLRMSDP